MGNPFITKGTTVTLGSQELKAVIVENPGLEVGEAENNTITASDGTPYSFAGQEGDNNASFVCIATHDTVSALMDSVYGTGTSVGAPTGGTLWNLIGAGGTTMNITFTPPTTSAGQQMKVIAVNAKGLVAKPIMELGTGWKIEVKYTCDKYQFTYDSSA